MEVSGCTLACHAMIGTVPLMFMMQHKHPLLFAWKRITTRLWSTSSALYQYLSSTFKALAEATTPWELNVLPKYQQSAL